MPLNFGQGPPSAHLVRASEKAARSQRAAWKREHMRDLRTRRMLKRRFPDLLALMSDVPTYRGMDPSIARDELLFERGWLPLVVELLRRLKALTPPSKSGAFRVVQIKEKWGRLAVYLSECNATMRRAIRGAEERSTRVCELCGARGKLLDGLGDFGGLVQTVCPKHAARYLRRRIGREIASFDGTKISTTRLGTAVDAARKAGVARWPALAATMSRAKEKLEGVRITIREIADVLPKRRLKLCLSDGSIVERDFFRLAGGVFDRFAEPRYFARVRLVHGALTWPGPKGWNEYQVVDLSSDEVIWGECPPPAMAHEPPAMMVVGEQPRQGVPIDVFRARLARRVLNAAMRDYDGSKLAIGRLRASAKSAVEAGVTLSRRALAKLEEASDVEAYLRAKRRNRGKPAIGFDEWMRSRGMRDIARALAKQGRQRR